MKSNSYKIRMEVLLINVDTYTLFMTSLKRNTDSNNKLSESDIIQMLEFLMDQTFVIVMWTCFPTRQSEFLSVLTVLIFVYSYEAKLHKRVSQEKTKRR